MISVSVTVSQTPAYVARPCASPGVLAYARAFAFWLVGWSLTSLFSTNTAMSETSFRWHSVHLYPPREGQATLTWVACDILKWFARPKTVTHPGTNRDRRRATSVIETSALPLSQTKFYKTFYQCTHNYMAISNNTKLAYLLTGH